ncbi:hypothetical protein K432DRAFT_445780 [Lepidopterella palustris CBS 459.81]|uniref:Mid2 domain-containing protein n=1 Tax=Lepidopterella palustris CBS 459.81 TaxID=1314670 RepID=A0A8E2E416_9PEZI|nr:hypothetical protein K432DRAFT_445780 [Lepidopterella palustris CBS 459.81]
MGYAHFFLALSCIPRFCLGQYQFYTPNNNTDFSQTWQISDTIPIAWQSGWHGVGDALTNPDLWISWFDEDTFSQLLQESVSLATGGSLNWKVNISNSIVLKSPRFVFRFMPHSDPPIYTSTQNEAPSRGFYIEPATNSQSTLVSSASTDSSTSLSSSSPTASPSSTTSAVASNPGLSAGAIAGIVIGAVALVALAALGMGFLLRYRNRTNRSMIAEEVAKHERYEVSGMPQQESLMQYKHAADIPEFDGTQVPIEMDAMGSYGFGGPRAN